MWRYRRGATRAHTTHHTTHRHTHNAGTTLHLYPVLHSSAGLCERLVRAARSRTSAAFAGIALKNTLVARAAHAPRTAEKYTLPRRRPARTAGGRISRGGTVLAQSGGSVLLIAALLAAVGAGRNRCTLRAICAIRFCRRCSHCPGERILYHFASYDVAWYCCVLRVLPRTARWASRYFTAIPRPDHSPVRSLQQTSYSARAAFLGMRTADTRRDASAT